ncbi:TetR/AcrR family transcriptional regulator [Bacillus sp. T3]|uniref:TetR/AcrR family transcriptional regulator n=1 Tax=Bacillus sp. T3 TaxID=467262 RepID=UPI0029828861|nr:TetR/AcrR family transcriptional regulator [Bacillus sp. T3]
MTKGSEKDIKTKDCILNATLELIKKEGLEKVTLRKIASLADVNLALINYYFGSKEKLINEVLKVRLSSFRAAFLLLEDESKSPSDRLKAFLLQYTRSLMEHPDLFREVFGKGNMLFEEEFVYKNYMKTLGLTKIKATIAEITGEEDPELITMMLMQITAATIFPTLISLKKNIHLIWNPLPIEKQIDFLFSHYFAKYN